MKVSVCIRTYNHRPFIAEALDSVLMQETDFDWEIILGEDESQDGTREMCIDYGRRYPDRIRLFLRSRKDVVYVHGKPTSRHNTIENLKAARGEYVALLDGDDYWTDPTKLQKQVTYLDRHPDCVMCAHITQVVDESGDATQGVIPKETTKEILKLDDILQEYPFHTSSVMFRNSVIRNDPDLLARYPTGDWNLFVLLAQHGNAGMIKQKMSVYRKHSEGLWTSHPPVERWVDTVVFYHHWYSYLGPEYHVGIIRALQRHFRVAGENLAVLEFAQDSSLPVLDRQAKECLGRMLAEAQMPSQRARLRRSFLSGFYGALGFLFYQSGRARAARSCFLRAVSNDWSWVRNAGVWSIVGESVLGKRIGNLVRKRL